MSILDSKKIDELCVNTIRMLSVDAIEKAQSGHPGLPMGMAAPVYVLWTKFLKHNPKNPEWLNRDRFILSAGHGSMLLYSLLHLTGYNLPLKEIKNFRQWKSLTPGHPEYGLTPGVEMTTGPLGQGFASGIGMALAERMLADRYNKPKHKIIDYTIYGIVSDGDLMEGVSAEAASYAAEMKLVKLIYLYDSNKISIEGSTRLTFCEDVALRFRAYDWQVLKIKNGNNISEVRKVIAKAKKDTRPSLIITHTHIGFGSPHKQDSSKAHGEPLGEEELKLTKEKLNWPLEPQFYIPEEALNNFRKAIKKGQKEESVWQKKFKNYKKDYPELAKELLADPRSGLKKINWKKINAIFDNEDKLATRSSSGKVMNEIANYLPLFVGGSADLAPSTKTYLEEKGMTACGVKNNGGPNLHFGVREHAMGAMINGLALSQKIIAFGGTFLVFSDYMRASIRLAAFMKLPVIYIFTHDSIGLGEDGPTHQPIEQLMSLRAIPNLTVIRPADSYETVKAWKIALSNNSGPTALILTRQKLNNFYKNKKVYQNIYENVEKGAYVLNPEITNPDVILIATGSEVNLVLEAGEKLKEENIKARVVSMPSWELFEKQSEEYRKQVFPENIKKRLSVETGNPQGWYRYTGEKGGIIGIETFGASAPAEKLMKEFGFSVENIVREVKKIM